MRQRMAVGMLVLSVAVLGTAAAAQAQTFKVRGLLHGGHETPPISPATGASGIIECDVVATPGAESADCLVQFQNVPGGITLSHFHAGQTGANGPVVCDATPQTPVQASNDGLFRWQCNSTTVRINAGTEAAGIRSIRDVFQALASGGLYFNVHTNERPGGEIRGPVCPILGPNENNPLTGHQICSFPR